MEDALSDAIFVRRSNASPEGAADAVSLEVVFITLLFVVFCWVAFASSPTRLASRWPLSVVRRSKSPMASVAHVALDGHEANESIGGGARPRQTSSTSAVVVLTDVEMMSAVLLLFVACCV